MSELVEAHRSRSPLASPQAFARTCVRIAVALAIAGVAGVVDRMFALPLAALIGLFALLIRLVEDDALGQPVPESSAPPDRTRVAVPPVAPAERAPLPEVATVPRTFRLPAAVGAQRVCLVGDFNGWSRTAHPMRRDGDAFTVDLRLVRGRSYRYRYLLDDARWENDWAADAYVRNEFGTDDSVVCA